MVAGFSRELAATRVEKVARIVSTSAIRESVVKQVYEGKKLPLEFRSFTEVNAAVEWLKET